MKGTTKRATAGWKVFQGGPYGAQRTPGVPGRQMYQEFWKIQRLDSIAAAKEKRCTTYACPRLPDPVRQHPV